jgi:hypothetical protein
MGINKYQIASISNLQSLYRYGYTTTTGTTTTTVSYCPKYSAITSKSWYKVTFNTESESKNPNYNICPAYYNWYNTGYGIGSADIFCKVLSGSSTSAYDSANIPIAYYYGTNQMYLFNKKDIYGQQGTSISLSGTYLMNNSNPLIIQYGCLARASLSLTAGFNLKGSLSISCNPIYTTNLSGYTDGLGADYPTVGSHVYGSPSTSSGTVWWLAVVGPGGLITSYTSNIAQPSFNYNFTVSTTGTYYFCVIPNYIQWNTQFNQYISGYVYNGVYLYFSSYATASLPTRSYSSNMLVRYMDISIVKSRTFTVKIYNNKGTQAKLDDIYAYYDTSSSETSSGAECGHLSIGNVSKNSTASYTLTLSFPASVMQSTSKYYVHIWCGYTNSNQTWSYKWGSGGSYSSTSKGTSRVTGGMQLLRTSSTNTTNFMMPNIWGTTPLSEMTFQIK